jgi:hypothetical protein
MIEPYGDRPSAYIDHYEYTVDGEHDAARPVATSSTSATASTPTTRAAACSPLKSCCARCSPTTRPPPSPPTLLRNMGVPGLLVSPDGGGATIDPEEAKETKEDLSRKFSGERRGEPIVMTGATKVEQFGFSPEQLLLRDLRRIPEERITAVLGIPAIVAGLGAGPRALDVHEHGEAREAAYESGLIPCQRILGEDIRFQLLPLYGSDGDPFQWRFGFDLKKVRVLQDDLLPPGEPA